MGVTELIKRAAAIMGGETKLAEAIGVSQNAIWQGKSRGGSHQRKDGQYQSGLCDAAADSAPSLMPSEPIVPDARHLPKLVLQ
jgi:hypothetical protein